MKLLYVTQEGESVYLTLEELAHRLEFRYRFHLEFFEPLVEDKVRREMAKATFRSRDKWFGALYKQELETPPLPALSVRWVSEAVGFGVFAEENLPARFFIGEYVGSLQWRNMLSVDANAYTFCYPLGKRTRFAIEAKYDGNFTRLINHSEEPNLLSCGALYNGLLHVILITKRRIRKGEQLSYDYGENYWRKRKDTPQLL